MLSALIYGAMALLVLAVFAWAWRRSKRLGMTAAQREAEALARVNAGGDPFAATWGGTPRSTGETMFAGMPSHLVPSGRIDVSEVSEVVDIDQLLAGEPLAVASRARARLEEPTNIVMDSDTLPPRPLVTAPVAPKPAHVSGSWAARAGENANARQAAGDAAANDASAKQALARHAAAVQTKGRVLAASQTAASEAAATVAAAQATARDVAARQAALQQAAAREAAAREAEARETAARELAAQQAAAKAAAMKEAAAKEAAAREAAARQAAEREAASRAAATRDAAAKAQAATEVAAKQAAGKLAARREAERKAAAEAEREAAERRQAERKLAEQREAEVRAEQARLAEEARVAAQRAAAQKAEEKLAAEKRAEEKKAEEKRQSELAAQRAAEAARPKPAPQRAAEDSPDRNLPLRELALAWFEARGYRGSPASAAVRPIELVLRHKDDPARAYAFVVENERVSADRVLELRTQSRAIGLARVLIVADAGADPAALEVMSKKGVRLMDRAALDREFGDLDFSIAAKIIAIARRRAAAGSAAARAHA